MGLRESTRPLRAAFLAAAALAISTPARAQPAPASAEVEQPPKIVRIALSRAAADKLSDLRVRRLVEQQLGGGVQIAEEPLGPLDEASVRVFIDMPGPSVAVVQVQAPGKRVETRTVDVSGLPWVVATRFVAIATSESVRPELTPRRKPKPRIPTAAEIAERLAAEPSFELGAALVAGYAGDLDTALFGSRASLSFHQRPLSETLSFTALGSLGAGLWVEGSLGIKHRLWVGPDLRFGLGGGFALAAANGVRATDDGDVDLWVRPHAAISVDVRLHDHQRKRGAFLFVGLEPGASVDAARERAGLWLGGNVGISYEGR